jgi:hypothetical protein
MSLSTTWIGTLVLQSEQCCKNPRLTLLFKEYSLHIGVRASASIEQVCILFVKVDDLDNPFGGSALESAYPACDLCVGRGEDCVVEIKDDGVNDRGAPIVMKPRKANFKRGIDVRVRQDNNAIPVPSALVS